jgi:prephenate dehydrogenase
MTIQVTIIGLGQMGGSIGLALAAHKEKIKRLGHDKDADATRAAQKAGAVDATEFNLPASVAQADVVVLSLPLNEVRETLDFIRHDLKEGVVILDLSPARRQGEAWARELLPAGRNYIGLAPAISPVHLLEMGGGLDAAHADLFQDAKFLVCPQPGISENAVRLATDFVALLGATPILSDASEADGLLAAMVTLPKLLAVSLVDATMDKPGWEDAQALAGHSYGTVVASAFDRDDADGLTVSALVNRDNLVRVLDGYLASLRDLRDQIQAGDRDELGKKIHAAQDKAYDWLAERHLEKYRISDSAENKKGSDNSLGGRLRQSLFGSLANPDRGKK